MELNKQGFVIKNSSGVEVFSTHSALSGVALGNGAVTIPVSDVPGLFYRVAAGEGRLTEEQRADCEQRAKAWYADRQPKAAPSVRRVTPLPGGPEEKKSED